MHATPNKNKVRLNVGFKINGGSKPFINHHFLTLGFKKKNRVRKWWFGTPLKFETPIKFETLIHGKILYNYSMYFSGHVMNVSCLDIVGSRSYTLDAK